MQDFILKFLLTVSSSTRKTNSNNLRINRIIHLFLILITDDAIFTLKYYPTRGNLWKPKTPLEQHPLRQSSASNGICAGSSLTGRASGADSTFTELSLGSPAKKTLAKSSPHSCACVHQGSTRQTDRWGCVQHSTAGTDLPGTSLTLILKFNIHEKKIKIKGI